MNETIRQDGAPVSSAFHALGTEVTLTLWPAPGAAIAATRALRAAAGFIRGAEQRLSRFLPDSEIARINRAGGKPVRVSRLTLDAIAVAVEAAAATNGLFDPTVYGALLAAGYDRTFSALRDRNSQIEREDTAAVSRPGGHRDVTVNRAARSVRLPAGAGIDLGGIAKGWLADIVAARLSRHGTVLADLGGDIALRGLPPGEDAWRIDVADPGAPARLLGTLSLTGDGAVATSGVTRRRWQTAAGPRHHLIDPRTGLPAATDLLSVTAVAPDAAAAEVVAKCTLLLGCEAGRAAIERLDGVAALLVRQDGGVLTAGPLGWEPVCATLAGRDARRPTAAGAAPA